ncbi:MAG: 2-succinyl-6-hydroxy-2,4-cyclohexadiene-1-carboxylate synthase [Deltaproteobacteria bacterium]|nr:2-succinyl-6-hydroxy-2,4-cyclohexadiene-1-carboxylate synthase [Deltaproteobacteria bacterium]MBW2400299.1 2-succinyl-6-hydroxy-2,4-cyclohexadiene-1-carboxylate synthase [Deltaproteobacteria bacterium]MBW2664672.1 2-succinyl-6-hydroxy-2,4-cyclohexadiene-1-carboxylate synthase [Deltaproteobacteria bacterium]
MKTDEHRIRSGGVELHALLDGDGIPVVILHGFTGSCASVEGIARDLSDHHRMLRIDFIGHGASDAPAEREPYHFDRCVDQIADVIGQLAHGPAHLIGYSMGGRVALGLCVARPELVKSATVIGARAGIENAAERAERVRDDEALADSIEREGVPAFVTRWMALPLFASQRRLGTARLAQERKQRLANRAHGLANSLRAMGAGAQPPLHARLAEICAPVCLVVGDEDARFAGIANALADDLPHARVETIPGSGHAAHIENPEAFLKVVRAFIDEVEAQRAHPEDPHAA